jgi:hypothetical protein
MNTAAICAGAEVRIPETGSVQLDDPAPWVDAHDPEHSAHPESGEVMTRPSVTRRPAKWTLFQQPRVAINAHSWSCTAAIGHC